MACFLQRSCWLTKKKKSRCLKMVKMSRVKSWWISWFDQVDGLTACHSEILIDYICNLWKCPLCSCNAVVMKSLDANVSLFSLSRRTRLVQLVRKCHSFPEPTSIHHNFLYIYRSNKIFISLFKWRIKHKSEWQILCNATSTVEYCRFIWSKYAGFSCSRTLYPSGQLTFTVLQLEAQSKAANLYIRERSSVRFSLD